MTIARSSLLILSVSIGLSTGCKEAATSHPAPAPTVTGLRVAQVHDQSVPETVDTVGTVEAVESATLAAQMTGSVRAVNVRLGDTVRPGQVLVTLDAAAAHADVERSEAAVWASEKQVALAQTEADLAASTLARYKILRDRKSISPQEYDEVSRRSEAATARLDATRAEVSSTQAAENGASTVAAYSRIHAPFSGVVSARLVDPGALATPGLPLLQVERVGALELSVPVDQSLLASLRRGATVDMTVDGIDHEIAGRVKEIAPAADALSRSFVVKVTLPHEAGLRSGMSGTLHIGHGTKAVLLVPEQAVVTHGSMKGVWVLNASGIASLRYVTLGAPWNGEAPVLSGLDAGERVVLSPEDRELSGAKIEAAQ